MTWDERPTLEERVAALELEVIALRERLRVPVDPPASQERTVAEVLSSVRSYQLDPAEAHRCDDHWVG
jgi:hypothetical protein